MTYLKTIKKAYKAGLLKKEDNEFLDSLKGQDMRNLPKNQKERLDRIFKEAQKYDVDSEDLDMGQIYTKSAPRLKTSKWNEGEQYH